MKHILLTIFTIMLSTQLYAGDGSSGCGPGWYVFKKNSLLSSALRITTNGILAPIVTLGMTFGTSNCTKHKIVTKEKESLHFVTMNYFELKSNMAKGTGQHVRAMAHTVGCSTESLDHASQTFKENYSNIFPDSNIDPERTLTEIYKVIFSDSKLINQCALNIG